MASGRSRSTTGTTFSANTLERYSLGTKNKNLVADADGALTLYVQSNSPVPSRRKATGCRRRRRGFLAVDQSLLARRAGAVGRVDTAARGQGEMKETCVRNPCVVAIAIVALAGVAALPVRRATPTAEARD